MGRSAVTVIEQLVRIASSAATVLIRDVSNGGMVLAITMLRSQHLFGGNCWINCAVFYWIRRKHPFSCFSRDQVETK